VASNGAVGDRLRVLIALMYAYPGTSPCANHMQRLARGLQALGHEPTILAPGPPSQTQNVESVDSFGIRYASFATPPKPRWLPYYPHWAWALRSRMRRGVERQIATGHWDVLITMGESGSIFGPVRRLCQRHGIPVLGYPIEWFPATLSGLLGLSWIDQELQRRFNYPRCDGLIGISRLWKSVAERAGIPGVMVPSFSKFPDDALPPVVDEPRDKFRLLFVGRWLRRELPITLFHGIAEAVKRGIDVELVVVGSAGSAKSGSQYLEEKSAIEALQKLPEMRQRIRFLGFIPEQQLIHEMAAADAFVLLREENRETKALFPTRLPEYLASGTPVILSDAGDLALYLKHKVSAYIIPPGNHPTELAEAIVLLASDRTTARAIGAGGRTAVVEAFSQTKLAARVADFIRSYSTNATSLVASTTMRESRSQSPSADA
jgi:glycosyltransferase involved in cell wall biosynthesis